MQVVAWNMQHRVASWARLRELGADIALLSEARAPARGLRGNVLGGHRTEGRDDYRRPWATAVVSPHHIREIDDARSWRRGRPVKAPFACSRPGSWTAAVVSVPDIGDVTAISLYGLMDEKSDASVHRSLSELTPVLEDPRYNTLLLLGGDLNTWTGWPRGSAHLARDTSVLQRIRAHGLDDLLERKRPRGRLEGCPCSLGKRCTHTRTRLDARYPDIPYQMDYLFASPVLAAQLVSCGALGHDAWTSPSDHYPIVATFAHKERKLDSKRGAVMAASLRGLGVHGVLITRAELGYLTKMGCEMPKCLCPDELGGRAYFEDVEPSLPDWMPTADHYPVLKEDGGRLTVDNVRLAHRLCNRVDYSTRIGRSFAKDLARVEVARARAETA